MFHIGTPQKQPNIDIFTISVYNGIISYNQICYKRNCTCENYIFYGDCRCFCFVRFWAQKNPQPGWLRISANRTFLFLRQRIFRRNFFSIPAVLKMGVEVFRKDDVFILRYISVQNNISSAHFTYRRHKRNIAVTISCIGGLPLFYK